MNAAKGGDVQDQRSSRGKTVVKRGAGLAVVAGVAFAASGCIPNTGKLDVVVVEQLSNEAQPFDFDKDKYVVPRGEVDVAYSLPQADAVAPHTLKIRDSENLNLAVSPSDRSDSGTVNLPPGVYELYCSVGPHAQLGMTAELVVV